MAIGNYYPVNLTISDNDLFLGTNGNSNNTVNYTAQAVADYLNTNAKVSIGGQLSFRFDTVPGIAKTISFNGGGGDNTPFSSITQLIVSSTDASGADITIFLNYLVNGEILLAQQNQPNNFGNYKITAYTPFAAPFFYALQLQYIGGNGNIMEDKYYDLSPFVLSGGNVPTLNQVLTAGNVSLLDAKVGELYLYDSANTAYGRITNEDSSFVAYEYTGNKTFSASSTDSEFIMINANNKSAKFNSLPLTATRTYNLPNASGTIALTSDIPVITTPTLNQVLTAGNASLLNAKIGVLYGYDTNNLDYGTLEFYDSGVVIKGAVTNQLLFYNDGLGAVRFSNGAYTPMLNFSGVGNNVYTFQNANGTVAFLSDIPSIFPNALTRVNDTNVTLTLGGTPNTALLQGVSLTLGWTGTLADSRIASASTWNAKQNAITLTTTGSSGPATFVSNTLNIPDYSSVISGYVPTSRTLTINGTTYDLTANRSWSVGTVTSVGLSMPSAFTVSSSPITISGTIAVTGAGVASQYVRGDGTLANFPTSTGGGASVSYYLNGSVSQGTIGGVAYKELNSVPVIGAGTDFSINADGYIAQFITDVGDPNKLLIPGGNWNFETYFSASSGGGTPQFYIELYKYDGTTFTLIASNSTSPEFITGGTSIDLYFSALAVPPTTLTVTDRLAVRFYVIHSGRTITMHTENSHLSQIITTFSSGLTALNGLTSQVQYLAVGTSGTDFNISSATDTHTFNLPTASATNRGALSSANWSTFNNKQDTISLTTTGASGSSTLIGSTLNVPTYTLSGLGGIAGSGTTNYIPKFTGSATIGNSLVFDNGTTVGIGTVSPVASSVLDLTSTTQGLLIPRMTTLQKNAISSPAIGLVVYDTNFNDTYQYTNAGWLSMGAGGNPSPFTNLGVGTTGTIVTGVTVNTITQSILIPANTLAANNTLDVIARLTKTGSVGSGTYRMYINTTNSLAGATLIATFPVIAGGSVIITQQGTRTFFYNGTNLTNNVNATAATNIDMTTSTTTQASIPYTSSVAYFLIFAIQLSNGADSSVMNGYRIIRYA